MFASAKFHFIWYKENSEMILNFGFFLLLKHRLGFFEKYWNNNCKLELQGIF